MRDEGVGLLDSVREAIEIGERARVPVQISHHKASGRDAWGLVADSLRLIEAARERGVDVTRRSVPVHRRQHAAVGVVPEWRGHRPRPGGARDRHRSRPRRVTPSGKGRRSPSSPPRSGESALDVARRIVDAIGNAATAIFHSMSEDDVRPCCAIPPR